MSESKPTDDKFKLLDLSKYSKLGDRLLIVIFVCLILVIAGFSFEAYLNQHLLFGSIELEYARPEAAINVSIAFGILLAGVFTLQLSRTLLRRNNFIWQKITIAL